MSDTGYKVLGYLVWKGGMSGTGYKALGYLVWKGGLWYLRRRYGPARRIGAGVLAATGVAAVAAAVAYTQRRGDSHSSPGA